MFRSRVAVIVIAATLCTSQPKQISVTEATTLVDAMLKADGWTKLKGFVLYQALFEGQFQDFYFIHADQDDKSIGHYAVDKSTGDVWDWVTCGRYSSPSLGSAQQALRKRMGLTDAEYQQIRKPGPFCAPDEKPHVLRMGRPSRTK